MFEAYPDMPFQGEVLKIAPQGQVIQNVTTFEVTSELKNVAATGTGQGMMRGAAGRRGGGGGATRFRKYDRRRTRNVSAQCVNNAKQTVMRLMAYRQDRHPKNPQHSNPHSNQKILTSPKRKPKTDDDDWGGLFGGFFEETPVEEPQPQTQPAETETSRMPFLKPGMNASVQISAVNKTGILTLPTEAVLDMRGRKMVRIVDAEGQPGRPQPVVTGVNSYDKIEIISGLAEGDIVALGGFSPGGGGGEDWRRRMMQNPASTMRRMGGGGGPRGR